MAENISHDQILTTAQDSGFDLDASWLRQHVGTVILGTAKLDNLPSLAKPDEPLSTGMDKLRRRLKSLEPNAGWMGAAAMPVVAPYINLNSPEAVQQYIIDRPLEGVSVSDLKTDYLVTGSEHLIGINDVIDKFGLDPAEATAEPAPENEPFYKHFVRTVLNNLLHP